MHSTKQIKWDGPKFMMGWTESNIKNLKAIMAWIGLSFYLNQVGRKATSEFGTSWEDASLLLICRPLAHPLQSVSHIWHIYIWLVLLIIAEKNEINQYTTEINTGANFPWKLKKKKKNYSYQRKLGSNLVTDLWFWVIWSIQFFFFYQNNNIFL